MPNTPTLVRRSQIGELLVAEGKLSREELAAALAYREERGLKLGQALVALHLVTQQDLAAALRSQGNVHCLNLTPGIVDPDVARLLPEAMARQYVAVPVHRVAGRVTVAMEDPAEEYDVDAIAVALGEPVFAVHADPERILEVVGRIHRIAAPQNAPEGPRFTLVRGPLPEDGQDEAADKLVRAALREALAIGAASFHVESTARGSEASFRVDGSRTTAALLPADWAEACARSLVRLAGGRAGDTHAAGALELDGAPLELDVATIRGANGTCVRAALVPRTAASGLDDLSLGGDERALIRAWLAARGVVFVAGRASDGCDTLASDLAARAALAGRRVYRLDSGRGEAAEIVAVPPSGDQAADLRAIRGQAPDVVETGTVADSGAWSAVHDLARAGALVVARVDAHDGSAAVARFLREADDPSSAARLCLGAIATCPVRLLCPACRGAGPDGPVAAGCPACRGTGFEGSARLVEVLDLQGPLGAELARAEGPAAIRAAAAALGMETLDARGGELVRRGIASRRGVTQALAR